MTKTVEERLEALEAESAIRKLKAAYLNACDRKDVEAIRACFTEDAELDYPPVGKFGLDGLIDVFTQMAATTPITDVHKAHNGEIDIDGDAATGFWNLGYATYDPREKSFRLLAGFYHDRYRKTEAGWKICYSRSEPRAIVDGNLSKEGIKAEWLAG